MLLLLACPAAATAAVLEQGGTAFKSGDTGVTTLDRDSTKVAACASPITWVQEKAALPGMRSQKGAREHKIRPPPAPELSLIVPLVPSLPSPSARTKSIAAVVRHRVGDARAQQQVGCHTGGDGLHRVAFRGLLARPEVNATERCVIASRGDTERQTDSGETMSWQNRRERNRRNVVEVVARG